MSKTERDLDLELDEGLLDDEALDDEVFDDEVDAVHEVDEVSIDEISVEESDDVDDVSVGDVDTVDEAHIGRAPEADVGDVPEAGEPWSELDDDGFVLPEIVMATEDDEDGFDGSTAFRSDDPAVAREGDEPDVSDDVLEELRRAEIDGPTVDIAPQDDTSSAIRRPRR